MASDLGLHSWLRPVCPKVNMESKTTGQENYFLFIVVLSFFLFLFF